MSSNPTSSLLAPEYVCSLCRRALTVQGPPIIGKPEYRLIRVAQMMQGHMQEHHQREMAQIAIAGGQYAGWRCCEIYQHNDAELIKHQEDARRQFRAHTSKVHITDETIWKQIDTHVTPHLKPLDRAGYDGQDIATHIREQVAGLLKGMRDTIEDLPPLPVTKSAR